MSIELTRLNHPELQLIELVEKYPIWVRGIVDGDSWGSNNKWHFDYAPEQWADTLAFLLGGNFIWIQERGPYIENLPGVDLHPSRSEIFAELTRTDVSFDASNTLKPKSPIWHFGLTAAGAAIWEQFADPNWKSYVEWGTLDADPPETPRAKGSIECGSRECCEAVLREAQHLGMIIDTDTMKWGEIRPWEVRYWKSLEVGFSVEFLLHELRNPDFYNMPHHVHRLLYGWRRIIV